MATITKRGQRWSVQIRRRGMPAQYKTFSSRSDAKAWATIQEAKIEQGEVPVPLRLLRATSLAEVLDRYLSEVTPKKRSASTEVLRLGKLRRDEICTISLARLSSAHIADYRDRRMGEVKAGTVRREMSLLHHALELARKEWGFRLNGNPVSDVAQPQLRNARDRRLDAGELDLLNRAALKSRNPLINAIINFAIETAMRRGEILNLTRSCVDMPNRTAHIPQTKTGKPRTIPLTDAALSILQSLAPADERVFPVTANAVKLAWGRVVTRAKLDNLHFHDLRHEAISRFFELGLSLPEVAVISGHRDPRMLFRYTHLRPAELAEKLRGRQWQSPLVSMAA